MSIDRPAYPDARRYITALNSAYNHLTHNLRFSWDSKTLLIMHILYKEANNPSSDWSKFLDKHRTGTELDDLEDICTTLLGLKDQSGKSVRKPAPTANILTRKRKQEGSHGAKRLKQRKKDHSSCPDCQKSYSLAEGQTCWYKYPKKAPEFW